MKKHWKVVIITTILSASCSLTAFAGKGWIQQDDGNWKYYNQDETLRTNGWALSGQKWYYLGNNGEMMRNALIEDQGKIYFVESDGAMAANRWVNHNDVYYYAGSDGAFLKSTITPDGYTVDANGIWDQSVPKQEVAEPINEGFVELTEEQKNDGAAVALKEMVDVALNPNTLYIKKVKLLSSEEGTTWLIIGTAMNKMGGYSELYGISSLREGGNYFTRTTEKCPWNSSSLKNAEEIDREKTINTYREKYNDNRTTISY